MVKYDLHYNFKDNLKFTLCLFINYYLFSILIQINIIHPNNLRNAL